MPHLLQYSLLSLSLNFFDPQSILFICKCVHIVCYMSCLPLLLGSKYWKQNAKKFLAVPEQIFHEFQQGTKGKKLR